MATQLVAPNLNTSGTVGMCLDYARRVFNAPAVEPTAWAAWNNTKFRHTDMNLPTDVAVPIWFSYTQNGTNFGHVAINVPGKGIYSSPWQQGTSHAVLNSISQLISIYSDSGKYPMAYVGWSEDISNVRVVMENDMLTPAEVNTLCAIAFNRQARDDEKSVYSSIPAQEALNRIFDSAENSQLRQKAANFDSVQAALDAANAKLAAEEQVQPAPAPPADSVTVTKDGFWQALLRFLGKE